MTLTLALAGDTMLGRGVAKQLELDPRAPLLHPVLTELARSADLFLLNLECCVSARGVPIDEPGKPFFFRAPPIAAERLAEIGVACVTLANNHVLDFGTDALLDTLGHLGAAGIATAGAGVDRDAARAGAVLSAADHRLRVVAVADYPESYAAGPDLAGIAFADLRRRGIPAWLRDTARPEDGELVLVTAHWGPNMVAAPVPHVRAAAAALESSGATLIAGHSAHVPHGPRGRALFDLGDFLDDYAVDPLLRNDLSLLWLVTLDASGPSRVEGVPVRLEYAYTRPADETETAVLGALLTERCAAVGSRVDLVDGRFVFRLDASEPPRSGSVEGKQGSPGKRRRLRMADALTATVEIPPEARHLLAGRNFAHVATLMKDGSPQVSPVWIDYEDGLVVFNTAEGRLKPRNLRRDPQVAISVTNSDNPYEHLLIRGRAIEITEEGADEHIDALAKRYLGTDEYPGRQPGEVRLIIRVRPERVRHAAP